MSNKVVFTAFDEKYVLLGASLISSLWQHSISSVKIVVLDTGLSIISKNKLSNWSISKGQQLEIIKVNDTVFKDILGNKLVYPDKLAYYSRLLVPYLCGDELDYVLYLDADILCVSNFESIFDLNLDGEQIVACCQDNYFKSFDSIYNKKINQTIIPNFKDLGFDSQSLYFNSGVLFMNVKKWRSQNISHQVFEITNKYFEYVILFDQYALNIVLNKIVFILDRKWNETNKVQPGITIFRHFVKSKPIVFKSTSSDKDLFFQYLDKSPWRFWRPRFFPFLIYKIIKKFNKLFNINYVNCHTK